MISQKSSALPYIADSTTEALRTGIDDITNFDSLFFQSICWRYPFISIQKNSEKSDNKQVVRVLLYKKAFC